MSSKHRDIKDPKDNVEVWSIEEARENWNAWVNCGRYEVAEVEDYLQSGRTNSDGESINYRKSEKSERTRRKKQRVKAAMTGFDKLKRMNKE